MIIDDGNSRQSGFAPFRPDSDHLAINSEELTRSSGRRSCQDRSTAKGIRRGKGGKLTQLSILRLLLRREYLRRV